MEGEEIQGFDADTCGYRAGSAVPVLFSMSSMSEENKAQPNCFRLAHGHVQMSLAPGIKGSDQILIILAQKIKQ